VIKKYLLDTNAYSAYLSGDKNVLSALAESDQVLISVIVLGELYAGFAGGSHEKKNREILGNFLKKSRTTVLQVSHAAAEIFGALKSGLKAAGTPIPINDVWISAQAVENGAKLITFDGHFKNVPGLLIWDADPTA
jgi:tRNA(fMet)-specific endonuclease VapC